ncbi:MAG: hypothetical protein ACP5LE_02280 [Thermoplasmata archaeon]
MIIEINVVNAIRNPDKIRRDQKIKAATRIPVEYVSMRMPVATPNIKIEATQEKELSLPREWNRNLPVSTDIK